MVLDSSKEQPTTYNKGSDVRKHIETLRDQADVFASTRRHTSLRCNPFMSTFYQSRADSSPSCA